MSSLQPLIVKYCHSNSKVAIVTYSHSSSSSSIYQIPNTEHMAYRLVRIAKVSSRACSRSKDSAPFWRTISS
eukprot:scaffold112390_cov57-Phaeocystis_antarctica.AAC.1